ncbi:putative metabolite transport protein YwtG [Colletotrichum liriopes]|uniref:Metabolite transport protein YwtG n=1 Tax=Colletotrichum liriopes TaxID=708192 RepID=A0AA37GAR9_9PEZI|nr:putative metabolite transport protein YwtG [Colletotrichum liriopes]
MPHLAKLMPNYVTASIALSFGGFLNGYDTGCIGAIVHMEQFSAALGDLSATVRGITVSMILLTGIFPSLFAGQLADKHGRLRVILPGAALFGLGALLQATSFSLGQFIFGRAVSGIGQGAFLANIAVYLTEIAPSRRRGRLAALPQFMSTLGICLGYFSCYTTSSLKDSMAWRLPYIVMVAVALMLALVCRILPESPRWLLLWGRTSDAMAALELLDFDMDEARRDFLSTPQEQPSLSARQNFLLPFRGPYRSRTLLALFILSMVQLSGIDAITYYAPALFDQAGISHSNSSLVASGVSSITMLVISIPAFMLADKWGRRTSAISGGVFLSGIMVLIGSLYAAGSVGSTGAARWVVVVSVFAFGMAYCATWGVVGKIYASEILPGNTRAAGNSIGMASCFPYVDFSKFTNWLVALITPILLSASAYGAYFFFGALTVFTVVVLALFMPETRGRSLENIQSEFRRPVFNNIIGSLCLPGVHRRTATSQETSEAPIELGSRSHEPSAMASSSGIAA